MVGQVGIELYVRVHGLHLNSIDDGRINDVLKLRAEVECGPAGMSWVMNTTTGSFPGSIEKMAEAAPAQLNVKPTVGFTLPWVGVAPAP